MARTLFALVGLLGAADAGAADLGTLLDDFEDPSRWTAVTSPGGSVRLVAEAGRVGGGLRVDFELPARSGYVLLRREIELELPANYVFTLGARGQAPVNHVEFKLVDGAGQNVWWRRLRNVVFPDAWHSYRVRRAQLSFAWGPDPDTPLERVGAIEIAIVAGEGGRGSVWLDELRFEDRKPMEPDGIVPDVRASSARAGTEAAHAVDRDASRAWHSDGDGVQWLELDFRDDLEFGGLSVDWDPEDHPTVWRVQVSDDAELWETVWEAGAGHGGRSYVAVPDGHSRYVRLELLESARGQGYGVRDVQMKPYAFAESQTTVFEAIARRAPRGRYPRHLLGEQTYWTVVGADGDDVEALVNEEGAVEVDLGEFSIEPFLRVDGKLVTWADVTHSQDLDDGRYPIPTVTWFGDGWKLLVTAWATGEPGESVLWLRYRFENERAEPRPSELFLALRPFQVNPVWQSLNMVGGVAPIRSLRRYGGAVRVNERRLVVPLTEPDAFGALPFDGGPLAPWLERGEVPPNDSVRDPVALASGVLRFPVAPPPGGAAEVFVAVPLHPPPSGTGLLPDVGPEQALAHLGQAQRFWRDRLGRVEIGLPPSAQAVSRTLTTTLAYILLNRDGPAIQPGPRNYARSWIRDGALTSAALLEMGHSREVREFLRWFATYQLPDGRIPCCVDDRGADPVPEHDSNGEFIFAVMYTYRFTRDTSFLAEMWPHVVRAVEHISDLRAQTMTEAARAPDALPVWGLAPPSISHEGYSSHPVHSYWDDFFLLRGLKDAADMAAVLGDEAHATSFAALRDEFRRDLLASIERAVARHAIDFIPGSVEFGDFDPTSTSIAVSPGEELESLPRAELTRTFERYFSFFLQRKSGEVEWQSYTPYELRNVGTLVRLGNKELALEALDFFLADQRPPGWNQWAEITWRDARAPRFIGDMPHTWVGSGFIRSVRSLFVYERESDRALVVAAGVPRKWIDESPGVSVKRLPTLYGTLNYRLFREDENTVRLRMFGDVNVPPGGIVVPSPRPDPLRRVTVNGEAITRFDADGAVIERFPADVVLGY